MSRLQEYFDTHREQHLDELKEYLRIPSISPVAEHKADVARCAQWTADALRRAGLQHVEIVEGFGNPIVYAERLDAPGKPTVLIYGHYDVQPAEPLELWKTPPFEPEIRDGRLYARGATDDKGQMFLHFKAVEALLRTDGSLPVNVKFCIEGEEELASPNLPAFVQANGDKLKADAVLISDSPMAGKGQPSITYGLRGAAAFELEVAGPAKDLHSGLFGGGVPNPIHALAELLASFHDADGRVAVEGFYDSVQPLSAAEREALGALPHDEPALRDELGVAELVGEPGYTYVERTTARPTLEVVAVAAGQQGDGWKLIVPAKASAKIACRLVADQKPEAIFALVERHVRERTPAGVTATVHRRMTGSPFLTPIDHPLMQLAGDAFASVYGVRPAFARGGGSVPIVEVFNRVLGAPVILMGFGLPEENMHSPNEFFDLDNFDKGLRTICAYLQAVGGAERKAEG